jgi:DNA repair protein RadC
LELAYRVLGAAKGPDGAFLFQHLTLHELTAIKGIGNVKAVQLLCVGELSKRIQARRSKSEHTGFHSPDSIAGYYMESLRHQDQEELHALYLDTKLNLIRESMVSKGTADSTYMNTRDVLGQALRCGAPKLVLVHNHPSGDPTPSETDYKVTKAMVEAAALVGVQVVDHVIIGDRRYASMRKEGVL